MIVCQSEGIIFFRLVDRWTAKIFAERHLSGWNLLPVRGVRLRKCAQPQLPYLAVWLTISLW